MAEKKSWVLPPRLRPKPDTLTYDLSARLPAMTLVNAEVPEDAFTATALGTHRIGNGIVIEHGLHRMVLTIGYLITEASSLWLTTAAGQAIEGHPMGYDQASGFGLIMPLGPIDAPPLSFGNSAPLTPGDPLTIIGYGGVEHALAAQLVARREFAGYWEYLLDDALFSAPAHPLWGGSAMLDDSGALVGVGSLLIQEAVDGERFDVNMFVPIDLLLPILDELVQYGRVNRPPRPWLGLYTGEQHPGKIQIGGVLPQSPAQRAGLTANDRILEVSGVPVTSLPEFYRAVWHCGQAGADVPLTISRGRNTLNVTVRSANRDDLLKKPRSH